MTLLRSAVHSCRNARRPASGPADYAGGSIANLAATLAGVFGSPAHFAGVHKTLDDELDLTGQLRMADTVILVVLDGVGIEQLRRHAPGGCLSAHRRAQLTSVFPSSTAPAITSLLTARPPSAHGTPAWFIHHDQPDCIVRSLPMDLRGDPASPAPAGLWSWRGWMSRVPDPCFAFQPDYICDSTYSRQSLAGAQRLGYRKPVDMLEPLGNIARRPSGQRRFAYVYLPHFDTVSHQSGWQSDQAADCLTGLDTWFEGLLAQLRGTNTVVLGIADHGFTDIEPRSQHQLGDYPDLERLLAAPLAGEPRTVFCRVIPGQYETFEQAFAASTLARHADLYRSEALLKAGWFGPADASMPVDAAMRSRLGSHTLVMHAAQTLVDQMPDEQPHQFVGMHGGGMDCEMTVPLIMVKPA